MNELIASSDCRVALPHVHVPVQAQIVSRKKEAAAETLNENRNELMALKAEMEEKQKQLRDSEGQGILKGDEVSCVLS